MGDHQTEEMRRGTRGIHLRQRRILLREFMGISCLHGKLNTTLTNTDVQNKAGLVHAGMFVYLFIFLLKDLWLEQVKIIITSCNHQNYTYNKIKLGRKKKNLWKKKKKKKKKKK